MSPEPEREHMAMRPAGSGDDADSEPDAIAVSQDDLQIRIAGIDDRVVRLERRLDGVDDELSRLGSPRPGEGLTWRRLPEFNLCPPVMQLTLDDEIALLQTTIQTRLERER
ncbi:MAG: hypothetical protein U0V56_10645 [Actinomycetota bacterium]